MNNLPFKLLNRFIVFFVFALILMLLDISQVHAKKRCKPYLEKLHNIQAMQRNAYSLKRGNSLRAKEDKAREKWWQCEHSSLAKFKALNDKSKKKSVKKTNKDKRKKYANNHSKKRTKLVPSKNKLVSFNQQSAIVIKSKYQGGKRQAWLAFYQKPIKCQRPKTLNVFAFCTEDKRQQQALFEQKYFQ